MPRLQGHWKETKVISELDNYIWHSLPATKYIAGRRVVRRIARRAAERFPTEIMESISMQGRARMLEQMASNVEREERQQYGMGIILTLVLSALISEIVKALWAWWVSSKSNRDALLAWQQEPHDD